MNQNVSSNSRTELEREHGSEWTRWIAGLLSIVFGFAGSACRSSADSTGDTSRPSNSSTSNASLPSTLPSNFVGSWADEDSEGHRLVISPTGLASTGIICSTSITFSNIRCDGAICVWEGNRPDAREMIRGSIYREHPDQLSLHTPIGGCYGAGLSGAYVRAPRGDSAERNEPTAQATPRQPSTPTSASAAMVPIAPPLPPATPDTGCAERRVGESIDTFRQRCLGTGTPPPTATDDDTPTVSWSNNAVQHRGQNGTRHRFRCPPDGSTGSVWGSGTYSDDSSICTAAVHAGSISTESGGIIEIVINPGRSSYSASSRHGVDTMEYGEWPGSFEVVATSR